MSSRSRSSTDTGRAANAPDKTPQKSFYIESLGCAKNQVDSELIIAALEKAGWTRAASDDEARVLIVNTCGFISSAKKESIETTLELKERHPDRRVIMVGCLSERYGADLARELPEIDAFLGNKDPSSIVAVAEGKTPEEIAKPIVARPYERSHLLSYPGSAYVKIAEGCDNRCTYCAIPLIRGGLASRERVEIVAEARDLLERGIRELILIAQDLGSFGKDRGAAELVPLLSDILAVPGDFWVRMLYIHPDRFPAGLLDVVAQDRRLLPYFDLPFQHASPGMLRAMGRRSDAQRNIELLGDIRARLPGAVIRSTFLVGFPGETEEDFSRLLDFQARARFDWLGAFTYSREEDTPAYDLPSRVPAGTARARKQAIESAQISITEQALDLQVGRTLDVLIEEPVQGEEMSIGRSYLQAPDVDGLIVVRSALSAGRVVPVIITRRNGVDLEGETV